MDEAVEAMIIATTTHQKADDPDAARWPDDYTDEEQEWCRAGMRAALSAADAARAVGDEEVVNVLSIEMRDGDAMDVPRLLRAAGLKVVRDV